MIPKERQDAILETLNNKGYISVEELSKKLYVSLATIRRDLNELEKNGFLKRTSRGRMVTEKAYDYLKKNRQDTLF